MEALRNALSTQYQCAIEVKHFDEHSMEATTSARAQASIIIEVDGVVSYAVASSEDTSAAALQALLTAFSKVNTQTEVSVA